MRRILSEQNITWRQAVDGSTEGPLATQWNVNGWPTIYVLDSQGVIRHRDLRGQKLEEAVVKLIAEAETGAK